MKFTNQEPKDDESFLKSESGWMLSEQRSTNTLLFYGLIVGILLTELLAVLIKCTDLIINFDFVVYKNFFLVVFLIPIHELVHLIFFPTPKNAIIGFSLRKAIFFVTSNDIFTKKLLLIVTIMPFILLTVLPICILFFIKSEIIAYFALFNSLGSGVDIISALLILKLPQKHSFRYNGTKLYYKPISSLS